MINARGPFTPLGVSRSPAEVREAVAEALGGFAVIEDLQAAASEHLARVSGAEAGTIVHCAAAGITLAVAGFMTSGDPAKAARLPDPVGMRSIVLLPTRHEVNFGQPVSQAIRLAGATPVFLDGPELQDAGQFAQVVERNRPACLVLVSSRLTRGPDYDLRQLVQTARSKGVPVVIDAAAQDFRIRELVATGADLVILSGQKYLQGPTAGLIAGTRAAVDAVRAQEKGIGRAMKASKEAIAGTIAALQIRETLNMQGWREEQDRKLARFLNRLNKVSGLSATAEADPTGLPFSRAAVSVAPRLNAAALVQGLRAGTPPVHVMEHQLGENRIVLETVELMERELDMIVKRLSELIGQSGGKGL